MSLALAMRSERDSLVSIGLLSNPLLLWAVVITFVFQLGVIYIPQLQGFFQTTPLSLADLGLCLGVSTAGFWAVELEKWVARHRSKKVLTTGQSL